MLGPHLPSRVEKRHDCSALGILCGETTGFGAIAVGATQTQIVRTGRATGGFWDDVIKLESHSHEILGALAIGTESSGSSKHPLA
jgi:hypothetical protein